MVTGIAELSIQGRGVGIAPENVQQLLIVHFRRIVGHLNRFGMTRASRDHLLVARIGDLATGVARRHRDDALHLLESLLHAPETASGKRRFGALATLHRLARGGHCQDPGDREQSGKRASERWRGSHNVFPSVQRPRVTIPSCLVLPSPTW